MAWYNEPRRHSLASKGIKTADNEKAKALGKAIQRQQAEEAEQRKPSNCPTEETPMRFEPTDEIVCRVKDTRTGFRHFCDYYRNSEKIGSSSVHYLNRTWESFEYETTMSRLLDSLGFSEEEKKKVLEKKGKQEEEKAQKMFGSIAMVAQMGEVLHDKQEDKNDWKLRMIKAGLGNKGIDVPDDWETLSEKEKEKRLNKVISLMRKGEQ